MERERERERERFTDLSNSMRSFASFSLSTTAVSIVVCMYIIMRDSRPSVETEAEGGGRGREGGRDGGREGRREGRRGRRGVEGKS